MARMSIAMLDVMNERDRQWNVEGWTPERDDIEHPTGELALAGACYAMQAALDQIDPGHRWSTTRHAIKELWPWSREWWKPRDRRRDLVRAGALIIAEIERLDRAATTPPVKGEKP